MIESDDTQSYYSPWGEPEKSSSLLRGSFIIGTEIPTLQDWMRFISPLYDEDED